jgi:uncharacterized protein YndB with AHSA1/START domain
MSTETVLVSEFIPATRERLYTAWLDSGEHSAFTADVAAIEPYVGGSHSAFSGYATGEVLELEPNRRIVQSWRSTDFPEEADDSRLEVTFEDTAGGTMITLLHTGIPTGQSDRYRDSWIEYYLQRMKKYFAGAGEDADGVGEETDDVEGMGSGAPTITNSRSSKGATHDDLDDEDDRATVVTPPPLPKPRAASGGRAAKKPAARQAQATKSARKPAQAAKSARKPPTAKAKARPAAKPKAKAKAAARRPVKAAKAAPKAKAKASKRPAKKPAKAAKKRGRK